MYHPYLSQLPQQFFLGRGFTRHAPSSDGINPHLRRAILLDQLSHWVQGHKETHIGFLVLV